MAYYYWLTPEGEEWLSDKTEWNNERHVAEAVRATQPATLEDIVTAAGKAGMPCDGEGPRSFSDNVSFYLWELFRTDRPIKKPRGFAIITKRVAGSAVEWKRRRNRATSTADKVLAAASGPVDRARLLQMVDPAPMAERVLDDLIKEGRILRFRNGKLLAVR